MDLSPDYPMPLVTYPCKCSGSSKKAIPVFSPKKRCHPWGKEVLTFMFYTVNRSMGIRPF
jgi:hypothetical protein